MLYLGMVRNSDPLEQYLSDLDGRIFFLDGGYFAKFVFHVVSTDDRKPHGFDYSLTLHDASGERVMGYDNAHPVKEGSGPGKKSRSRRQFDHRHRGKRTTRYEYKDLATLLDDFWDEVDRIIEKE